MIPIARHLVTKPPRTKSKSQKHRTFLVLSVWSNCPQIIVSARAQKLRGRPGELDGSKGVGMTHQLQIYILIHITDAPNKTQRNHTLSIRTICSFSQNTIETHSICVINTSTNTRCTTRNQVWLSSKSDLVDIEVRQKT